MSDEVNLESPGAREPLQNAEESGQLADDTRASYGGLADVCIGSLGLDDAEREVFKRRLEHADAFDILLQCASFDMNERVLRQQMRSVASLAMGAERNENAPLALSRPRPGGTKVMKAYDALVLAIPRWPIGNMSVAQVSDAIRAAANSGHTTVRIIVGHEGIDQMERLLEQAGYETNIRKTGLRQGMADPSLTGSTALYYLVDIFWVDATP